jgi:hypothetical protein
MQRLSLIAFSMVNRDRQWVTEAELDADLAALLGRRDAGRADFRVPLSQAGIAVGRFFFVQRSQAISADTRLQTFEFLHATFGEYLAARLTVQLAAGLLDRRPALNVGRAPARTWPWPWACGAPGPEHRAASRSAWPARLRAPRSPSTCTGTSGIRRTIRNGAAWSGTAATGTSWITSWTSRPAPTTR